jgi:hypothetical protein
MLGQGLLSNLNFSFLGSIFQYCCWVSTAYRLRFASHTHTHKKKEEEEEANHTQKIRNKSYNGEGEPTRQLFRVISLCRSPILYMLMRMLGFFFFFFFFLFFVVEEEQEQQRP